MADKNPMVEIRPGGRHGGFAHFGHDKVKLKNPKETLQRILSYMEENKSSLIITFFLCMATALVSISATRINGYAVDHYIEKGDMRGLFVICMILAGIYMIGVASTYIQNRFMVRIAQETSASIRKDLYQNIQKLPVCYYDTHSSGDLMSRLTNDVDNINMTLSQNITQLFTGVVNIIGMTIAMLLLSPLLFLAGIVTLPFVFLLSRLIVRKAQPYFVKQQMQLGTMNGYIEERISGQKLILLFGKEQEAKEEFADMNIKLRNSGAFSQSISGVLGPVNNLINNLTYFVIAVTGAYLILSGFHMTVGVIFTFILYMRGFIQPINQIMNTFNTIQSALAGAERVFDVIDEKKEELNENPAADYDIKGEIEIQNVDFSYVAGKPILKNISLLAHPGKTIAIVGPTGSGKTTIMNLLTRFYDIDSGNITIDGMNIMELKKKGLRKSISMVLQDTFLFSETVRQNIRYGRLDATDEEVEKAARIANAHSFIMQLPEGYDTVLSDNGSNLSQGQKQLLAIARAVLAKSAILILDEATSSIDTRTELKIQDAMLKLMEGKTTFIIAHRLSTIRNADEILVLKDGEILERGNHKELMDQKGFYAQLCQTQYKGIAI